MNETDLLALGDILSKPADVLLPGERIPFHDYLRRVLNNGDGQVAALFADPTFSVSVDKQPIEGLDSMIPVTAESRVVLYRRQGPFVDVAIRGALTRICLN